MKADTLRFEFTELTGTYEATLASIALPRDRVAALLPRGIALDAAPLDKRGEHPVLLCFGRHREVELEGALRHIPTFPLDYLEVIAAIPFVRPERRGPGKAVGPFMHLANLYLNDPMAIFGGVTIWGFPKKPARIDDADGRFRVRSPALGRPLFEGRTEAPATLAPALETPAFAAVAGILAQPLLQRVPAGLLVASTFDWRLASAEVGPCRATVRIEDGLLGGLAGAHEAEPIDAGGLGALRIRNRWRLSLPYPPEAVP